MSYIDCGDGPWIEDYDHWAEETYCDPAELPDPWEHLSREEAAELASDALRERNAHSDKGES